MLKGFEFCFDFCGKLAQLVSRLNLFPGSPPEIHAIHAQVSLPRLQGEGRQQFGPWQIESFFVIFHAF